MLQEISSLHIFLTKQEKLLAPNKLSVLNTEHLSKRYNDVAYLLLALKNDPVACYVQLKAVINTERKKLEEFSDTQKIDQLNYIKLLEKFFVLLKNTELIKKAEPLLDRYDFKREIYHSFFRPEIIPNFTFTRLVASLPEDGEIIDQYKIGEEFDVSHVTILKRKRDAKFIYHLMPPEYSLEEDKQELINLARNVLIEHQPKAEEFTDPERTRQVFFNVSRDLLRDLAESKKTKLRMISGRPLDEANPILDTDLSLGNIRSRMAVIQQPLSPSGLAYAVRRHRDKPWTLPLFIKNKMINSFTAGLLSF